MKHEALTTELAQALGAFETIGYHLPKDNLKAVNEAICIARGFLAAHDSAPAPADCLHCRITALSADNEALRGALNILSDIADSPMNLLLPASMRARILAYFTSTKREGAEHGQ